MGDWTQEDLREAAATLSLTIPAGFGAFGFSMSYQEAMALPMDEFEMLWEFREDALRDIARASKAKA